MRKPKGEIISAEMCGITVTYDAEEIRTVEMFRDELSGDPRFSELATLPITELAELRRMAFLPVGILDEDRGTK